MARTTPELHDGWLHYKNDTQEYCIAWESPEWWEWLEHREVASFRCTSFNIHFTVRKEYKQKGHYWYAYSKQKQKLHKVYLGKSAELTQANLQKCAETLTERLEGTLSTTGSRTSGLQRAQITNADLDAASTIQQVRNNHAISIDLPQEILHGSNVFLDMQHELDNSRSAEQEIDDDFLLYTKLSPAVARSRLVARPDLYKQLQQGTQHRLTLVSAPAGSGKSTLLSSWYRAMLKEQKALAWIALDTKDNHPTRFWKVLTRALEIPIPIIAQHNTYPTAPSGLVQSAIQVTQAEKIDRLLQALKASKTELTIVFDDYHLITDPTIHEMCIFLIEHLPTQIHVVIATRCDPPFPIARWRVQGDLSEIRTRELRFTRHETNDFFQHVMTLKLSPTEIDALLQRTEGWVAGLQLAGISLQGHNDPQRFIATFSGEHGHIVDYLGEEVLKQQPDQIQNFLLSTSILEQFNSALCNSLLARQDSQEVMKTLEQANLFIIALDEDQHWYRYHHLFAEFLSKHLMHTDPEQITALHKRAATWYMQNDYTIEALDHLLKAQDFMQAAQYLENSSEKMVNQGEMTTLIYWVERLPKEIMSISPHLTLSYAGALCATDQLEAAALHIQEAEHMIKKLEGQQTAMHADVTDHNGHSLKELQCSLSILQTVLAGFRGDVELTLKLKQRAQELLGGDNISWQSILVAALGTAYALNGDLEQANKTFMQAEIVGQAAHNAHVLLASASGQAYFLLEQGQFQRAAERYQQIMQVVETTDQQRYSAASMVYLGLGEIHYYLDNLELAEQLLRKGMELGQQWGFMTLLTQGTLFLSRVKQAKGDLESAEEIVQGLEMKARQWYVDTVVRLVGAIRANLWLAQGKREMAARWAYSTELQQRQTTDYRDEVSGIIQAQILTAQGDLVAAESMLDQLLLAAESSGRYRNVLHILVRQALLYQKQEKVAQAQTTLLRALASAEIEGVQRIFIDEGPEIQILLTQIQVILTNSIDKREERLPSRQFITEIIRKIEQQRINSSGLKTERGQAKEKVQLTERERDVLTHLVHGATNQQIADALVLEVSTVKWYLKQIYNKLGTHNRLQVVIRAQELQLT